MRNFYIEMKFPRLHRSQYKLTSPATSKYNCIAWAAGDDLHWWEPDSLGLYHWPKGVPRQWTMDAYVEAFRQIGFEICEESLSRSTREFENGWEKIAIYAKEDGRPTHATRQLSNGTWTSKLGKTEDIQHENPDDVGGAAYGEVVRIMRRPNVREQ